MHDSAAARGRRHSGPVEAAPPNGVVTTRNGVAWRPVADTDEAAASEARAWYRKHALEPLEPDERICAQLVPGEQVLAAWRRVCLERPLAGFGPPDPNPGDLYLTSARLIHVGARIVSLNLDDIEDAAFAKGRLLLLMGGGLGIALVVDRPRLLRVQVAAARSARAGVPERRQEGPQRELR